MNAKCREASASEEAYYGHEILISNHTVLSVNNKLFYLLITTMLSQQYKKNKTF